MGLGCGKEGMCIWARNHGELLDADCLYSEVSRICCIPLFAFLDRNEIPRLAGTFSNVTYAAGAEIYTQGEAGEQFFIVKSGVVSVHIRREDAPDDSYELVPGDYFGEEVLVGMPRPYTATARAREDLEVWVLERRDFEDLGLRKKLHFKKRAAVFEGRLDLESAVADAALLEKSEEEHALLRGALFANGTLLPFLQQMCDGDVDSIVRNAYRRPVPRGERVLVQGELKADLFFIVGEGRFDVARDERSVEEIGRGKCFGERALLYRAPRDATVRALCDGHLWCVPRRHFREVLREQLRQKVAKFNTLLCRVELFNHVDDDHRQILADALVETTYYRDEYIIRQGEEGNTFFILYEGEVSVDIDGVEVVRLVGDPAESRAEFFGERALLTNKPRAASVRAVSDRVLALALDRETFEAVLLQSRQNADVLQYKFARVLSVQDRQTYSLDRLEEVGLLGTGALGAVTLVKDKQTHRHFALKAVSKGLIMQMQTPQAMQKEKLVLQTTRSPFLIRLAATFNTAYYLYFLMELALGGELYTIYRRHGLFGSAAHARFYAACTLRGLEHLHERHIIYRDLKTENLLLGNNGYCKLTDFGMATFTKGHAYTLCGTPEYMAPEVISCTGHSAAADWWSLGILIYECMEGETPFVAEDNICIFRKVRLGIEWVHFPKAQAWADLVRDLCRQDPSERIPVRRGGVRNVEQHPWFAGAEFNWGQHRCCMMDAPYIPELKNPEDLTNFDTALQEMPAQFEYDDPGDGWDEGFEDKRGPRFF